MRKEINGNRLDGLQSALIAICGKSKRITGCIGWCVCFSTVLLQSVVGNIAFKLKLLILIEK